MIHWLVNQGAVRDLVAFCVGFLCSAVVGWVFGVRRKLRNLLELDRLIADRLDTSTPGGLGDLLAAFNRAQLDPGPSSHGQGHR